MTLVDYDKLKKLMIVKFGDDKDEHVDVYLRVRKMNDNELMLGHRAARIYTLSRYVISFGNKEMSTHYRFTHIHPELSTQQQVS